MSNSWWYKNKTSDQKVRSTLTQASHQIELYARLQASLNQSPLLFYVDRLLTKEAQEVQLNPKAKLYFYGDLLTTQNIALLAKARGFEAKREDYSHKKEPKGMPCGCCHKGVASFRVRVKMTAESRIRDELAGELWLKMTKARHPLDPQTSSLLPTWPVWVKRHSPQPSHFPSHSLSPSRSHEHPANSPSHTKHSHIGVCYITVLSEELLLFVFGFLKHTDLVCAGLTCKKWQRITNDNFIWHQLFLRSRPVEKAKAEENALRMAWEMFIEQEASCQQVYWLRKANLMQQNGEGSCWKGLFVLNYLLQRGQMPESSFYYHVQHRHHPHSALCLEYH